MLSTTLLAQKSTSIGGEFTCLGGYCPDPVAGGSGTGIGQFTSFASNLFAFLTTVGGMAFILFFALGALSWITAGGDSNKVDKAKAQMTNAAIGLIAIVATYAIVFIIGQVLGLDILNPSKVIESITPGSNTGTNTIFMPVIGGGTP